MKATDSFTSLDDPKVVQAMEEYLAAIEAGHDPERRAFLARHADIAGILEECLDSLEFVHQASRRLHGAGEPLAAVEGTPGTPLGDFRIIRELGRGGMGVVYEAEQLSLQRRVALKVLPLVATLDAKQLQRFLHEAQAAASLHHAHIVPVFAVGCDRGVHYYAMQFIEGQSLAQVIADLKAADLKKDGADQQKSPLPADGAAPGDPPLQSSISNLQSTMAPTQPAGALTTERCTRPGGFFRSVANLGVQAAEALKHAHELGIVHRDIKPANLLVDVRGNLWVTDFGLAHCQSQPGLTMSGDLVGTLRYMSPEQALAQPAGVDARTDIYALGATLYELLTLEPPFSGLDRQELLRQIGFEEPTPVRRLNPDAPAELETIVLKALAKVPAERYASAADLAGDLQRFLNDEPIRARPPTLAQRSRKWARRHRPVVWSAAAALLVILAVLAGSAGWIVRDRTARQTRVAADLQAVLDQGQQAFRNGKWPEAQAAAIRAKDLLKDSGAEAVLGGRVQDLLHDLLAEEADRHLLTQLEDIRLRQTMLNVKENRFALEEALPEYQQAFQDHGFAAAVRTPAEAAALLQRRSPAIRDALLVALDHWLILARYKKAPEAAWLEQVLAAADPDPWRQEMRVARRRDPLQARQTLERLAREVDVSAQPPEALFVLALGLRQRGAAETAVALLRRAQEAFPGNFWLNEDLGLALQDSSPPQLTEAIRFLTAAVAIRPDSPGARLNLGDALRDAGRLDEAAAAYRRAIELQPDYAEAYGELGNVLQRQGRSEEAMNALRQAIALKPAYAVAHANLGAILWQKGRADEAIPVLRRAIELNPDSAEAHCNLGCALRQQGQFAQALAALKRGHELGSRRPDWPYPSAEWVRECQQHVKPEGAR
ncbi:MAG TPA: tetratricopeptide repeat protein [Gemmataceae bacterium]|nr:tetratricopeptide repeat protein [Gemmataceae bacterium]